MSDLHWKTSITKIEPNNISVRGYPVDRLMGTISFSQGIYLVLRGEMPSPEVGRLMDALFLSSIDHGASPPSALTARTLASTGNPLNAAVAGGILAVSRFHGGAIEGGMRLFYRIARIMKEEASGLKDAVRVVLDEMIGAGERIPGFGHRIHSLDPRARKLFSLAEELGLSGIHIGIARTIEEELEKKRGKRLPINVDGAIAAVLCDLGFSAEIGNAFFIIPRVAGLVAHIQEEKTRMKPMRKIHPQDFEYDGPENQELT